MLTLHVQGRQVGTIADAERLLPAFSRQFREVEVRTESGELVSRIFPAESLCPWDPLMTQDEIERRSAKGGKSLAEFWREQGVQ